MRRIAAALLFVAVCASAQTPAPAPAPAEPSNPALRAELVAMKTADQEVRHRWVNDRENPKLQEELKALDTKNLARLKQIIDQYGWPTVALVGRDGVSGAWVISQHSVEPEFLHRLLPMMKKAVETGDLAGGLYATSDDRVRLSEGKKQLYGSQFDTTNGKCEPKPIEDPEHVEERRKAIGLGPLGEYKDQLCKLYHAGGK